MNILTVAGDLSYLTAQILAPKVSLRTYPNHKCDIAKVLGKHLIEKWWPVPDLNRGPTDYEAKRIARTYAVSCRKVSKKPLAKCAQKADRNYSELC